MKYVVEENLQNFKFWSGAKNIANALTYSEMNTVEAILEDCYCDSEITDTQINDLFWFEPDTIAEWLGYSNWEELMKDRD